MGQFKRTLMVTTLLAIPVFANAQAIVGSEASAPETVRFVKDMLGTCKTNLIGQNNMFISLSVGESDVHVTNDFLEFTSLFTTKRDVNEMWQFMKSRAKFSELDPTPKRGTTDNGLAYVSFDCARGACVNLTIHSTLFVNNDPRASTPESESKSTTLSFPACIADSERFGRAIAHLIKLSGGKVGMFK